MFVQKGQHKLLLSTASQALFNVRTSLAVLGEVLNGTNHLRGVGVLVVVPRHDLNLIGVVVATLNFHDFFVVVHNFETTVTVPQHTVVVPKPACSYQNYTTFRRYFQVLSWFFVLELSYSLYSFLFTYIFMWLSVLLLGASGTRGCRRGRSPCPDALLCCLFCWNFTGSDFEGWMEKRGHFCLIWNIYALRPDSCTYKHPYISPWKHTRSYSFYALHSPSLFFDFIKNKQAHGGLLNGNPP